MLVSADELKNTTNAHELAGVSQPHFLDDKKAYEIFGEEKLISPW